MQNSVVLTISYHNFTKIETIWKLPSILPNFHQAITPKLLGLVLSLEINLKFSQHFSRHLQHSNFYHLTEIVGFSFFEPLRLKKLIQVYWNPIISVWRPNRQFLVKCLIDFWNISWQVQFREVDFEIWNILNNRTMQLKVYYWITLHVQVKTFI